MTTTRSNPALYVLVSLGALVMLFPIWWMLVVSLKTESEAKEAMAGGEMLQVLPGDPQWNNFAQAISEVGTVPVTGFVMHEYVPDAGNLLRVPFLQHLAHTSKLMLHILHLVGHRLDLRINLFKQPNNELKSDKRQQTMIK